MAIELTPVSRETLASIHVSELQQLGYRVELWDLRIPIKESSKDEKK